MYINPRQGIELRSLLLPTVGFEVSEGVIQAISATGKLVRLPVWGGEVLSHASKARRSESICM